MSNRNNAVKVFCRARRLTLSDMCVAVNPRVGVILTTAAASGEYGLCMYVYPGTVKKQKTKKNM